MNCSRTQGDRALRRGSDDRQIHEPTRWPKWAGYPIALLLEAALTAGLLALHPHFPLGDYPITYVVAIMAVAYWLGEGPALLAFVVGLLAFDYFFIPPLHTILPHPVSVNSWAQFIAFYLGTSVVGFAMAIIRRSQRRTQRLADELRRSGERLNRTQQIANVGSWELDLVKNELSWSDEVFRIFGLQPQEFGATYEAFIESVYPDDRAAVDAAYTGSVREGNDSYEIEHRVVRHHTGEIRWVHEKCEHERDETGGIIRSVGMVHDITERKNTEEELKESRQALERHLSLLQQALVPPQPAIGSGCFAAAVYVPAFPGEQIGGDFYDVFTTERGQIGIVIGDVAGKGIGAAALAAAARSTIHSFAYELASPGAVLFHANAVLHSIEPESERFTTAFLVIIDPSTGMMGYARAGHPPAAIWRTCGDVDFLEDGGLPLGIMAGQDYGSIADCLDPGDKVVLYTDGIMEAVRGGDMFGLEGIQRVLETHGHGTPEQVAAGLFAAARDWANGRLRDDVAILVIERTAG